MPTTEPSPREPTAGDPDERIPLTLLLRAAVALAAVDLSLRVVGYQRTRRWLRKGPRGAAAHPDRAIRRTARAVDAAARRHLYPMTCLRRALVLQHELRRLGVETDLQLGVRRAGDGLEAHAWLERDGQPVRELDDPRESYRALERANRRGTR